MACLIFLYLLSIQTNDFCSCIHLGDINDKQYNQYDLIIKAKISKVAVQGFGKRVDVVVETVYKGHVTDSLICINTASDEGACGISPKFGEYWLIFAHADGDNLSTDLCTRTKSMNPKAWNYNKETIARDIQFLEAKTVKGNNGL